MKSVSLKEYFEAEIKHLRELRKADKAALELQAKEYERRLTALNHAHEEAVKVQHTYVTQDKYDDFILRYNKWQGEIDHTLYTSSGSDSGITTYRALILQVVPILISLVAIIYALYK